MTEKTALSLEGNIHGYEHISRLWVLRILIGLGAASGLNRFQHDIPRILKCLGLDHDPDEDQKITLARLQRNR